MGVLLSRRQTVEQVQKVSLAVSAFKDGLRERPAGSRRGTLEEQAVRELGEEEAEAEKAAAAAGGASRPGRGGVRSTAWARLRDGRGVEPEDLEPPGCFAPPALVRPVRPPRQEEEERLEVSLEQREQVTNEEMCEVCEVWTADSLLPCRVCTKAYHDGCLQRMGLLSPAEAPQAIEAAHSAAGWSCYHCDNLNSLLTDEEMGSLSDAFQQSNVTPESSLSLEDFLRYKGLGGQPSSEEEKKCHALQFGALDPGQKGRIAWTDFLSHESLLLLQRTRTQEGLLHLLTGKEREWARDAFLALDRHRDGLISQDQSRRSQHAWFQKRHPRDPSSSASASQAEPVSEGNSRKQEAEELPREEPGEPRTVTWAAFLRESTIYILAARPNSAALHLKPLM